MSWNYCVVKTDKGYAVHEVYYGDDGKANGVTEREVSPFGETRSEFEASLALYEKAWGRPVLLFDGNDFVGVEPPLRTDSGR